MKHAILQIICFLCACQISTQIPADEIGVQDVPPPPKITLKEGTWKDVQKYVTENKGKVVVVDIWSTSCLPCMTEFPNLVKLQDKYGKQIVCVSVCIDYAGIKSKPPSYYRPRVEKFLKSRRAALRNYLMTADSLEILDELKLNSIPAVFVYGKDGKLVKQFDDKMLKRPDQEEAFTYEADINPFVAKLIGK